VVGDLALVSVKPSHDLLGDFVVAPVPDALPSLIVRREEAPSAGSTGSSS